jgi:uncharacterized membrane protein
MPALETSCESRSGYGVRCYLAGILFPMIYLTTAPYNTDRFIRFHSFQSIVFTSLWVAVMVSARVLRNSSGIVGTVLSVAWVAFFITWILLMIRAYQGRTLKLPLVGSLASRWAGYV